MSQATCLKNAELHPFLDGLLPEQRTSEIEEHLADCPHCCQRIQASAGGPQWWNDVKEALSHSDVSSNSVMEDPLNRETLLSLLGPTDRPDMLGRIGPYEIVGILGQGGMGGVFKAHDPGLNRFVAIKVLLPHLAASGAARARFRREGQAAAAVIHDHVLPVYAVDEYRNTPYLVMQYIRGMTLQHHLAEQGPLPIEEILRIGLHAARGLQAAHCMGLIHRDIKPSNILLDGRGGRAVLSDFGLARTIDDASLTRSGTIAGTPLYMSPEQIRGDGLDARSDLFSLGSVLYTMCTGHPPFRAESSYAVIQRIVHNTPRSIREAIPDTPAWLEQLIFWLLEKDPVKRPQTAQHVATLMQTCLTHIEQPTLVSLPAELQNFKVTKHKNKVRQIMLASALLSLTGGLLGFGIPYLFTGPVVSGPTTTPPAAAVAGEEVATQEEEEEANSDEALGARTKKLKGSTMVEGHKVELMGIGEVQGMPGVTRFRPKTNTANFTTQQFGNNNANQFGQFQNFDNGNGTGGGAGGFGNTFAGGGGFAGAGGGGSTAGATFTLPNQGIAVKISEAKSGGKKKVNQIVELGSAVKVVERDGTIQQATDMGPITHSWPEFEKLFPGSQCLFLYRQQPISEPFQQLEAELHITPGRKIVALFQGDRPQKKKVSGEEFAIQSVQASPQGVQVVATFPMTNRMKKSKNLQERMMAMMASTEAFELEIEDSQGKVYVPTGKSGSGTGGGSFQGFSFNGNTQTRSSQSPEPSLSTITFQFPPLPSNNGIKSITAILRDVEGETEKVPFTIEVE